MKNREKSVFWDEFEKTGRIGAYLLYKAIENELQSNGDSDGVCKLSGK
ncbi:MAG: YqzL family protein [Clostridia bacterium]